MRFHKPEFLPILGTLVLCLLMAVDRWLKYLAPIKGWSADTLFGLQYFENTGIAGSISIPLPIVLIGSLIIVSLLLGWIRAQGRLLWPLKLSAVSILLGGASNFYDRIQYGYVIDYFKIHHAVINIADILIVAGLFTLILYTKRTK